jgi:hypothetical protein
MMNEKAVKKTVTNLIPNEFVKAGYTRRGVKMLDLNRFHGFKVGELRFTNVKVLKKFFGVRNLRDLEFELDRLKMGSCTIEFECVEDRYTESWRWAGYLYQGCFRVGSSADRLVLKFLDQD